MGLVAHCQKPNSLRSVGTIRLFYYLAKVIAGVKFTDGIEVTESDQVAA